MSFINATRQNLQSVSTMKYEKGLQVYHDISKVGLLAKVYLRFEGSVTAKHATKTTFTKAHGAPFNLADRVGFVLNNGTSLWNTSGWGCQLLSLTNKLNNCMNEPLAQGSVFKFGNKCSAAGTKNDLEFTLVMNMAVNDRDLVGLLMLQSSQVVATVKVDNADPGVLTSDTDITMDVDGAWHIMVEYFSIPQNPADYPALGVVHQVQEDFRPITAVGQNEFTLPQGNTYMKIINEVLLNGAPNSADIDRMTLKYNRTQFPYDMTAKDMLAMQVERYGRALPEGVFVWDFFYSNGLPNLGNQRDFVNTENISQFDQMIQIAGGATLGSNNNNVRIIRDMLVPVNG